MAEDGTSAQDHRLGAARRPSLTDALRDGLDAERSRFFLWAPVCLGSGIAVYFALLQEPGLTAALAPVVAVLLLLAGLSRGSLASVAAVACLLACVGFLAAKLRVEAVAAPVLTKSLSNVTLVGRIERVEAKAPRGERLTLSVESLAELPRAALPKRVRVRTLRARDPRTTRWAAGTRVSLKATLSPPARPAIPGGFDFARSAYFEGLGGVGYTLSPVAVLPPAEPQGAAARVAMGVEAMRAALGERIRAALPGETGAIATALITGERGGISEATNEAYRSAGLFHILSISGLHMVVMAGAVFFCVRLLLASIPSVALRFPIKKWAAAAGIAAALLYLAISGGAFATVRSAVQIIVMFAAVLLDRPALALRNVALAAFLILLIYPESLFDPGFQMSFAAVAALVAAYEEVRRRFSNPSEPHPVLRVLMFFGGIVLSTLIASVAVAPFAAYHFHQSQQYAVIANLLAIPICNFIVMPAALGTLVVMPFGLEALPLFVMGKGIDAMTWCAGLVAKLPGAVGHVRAIPQLAFLLLVAGGLWLILWRARWRLAGAALAAAGLAMAPSLPRPDVLIARGGELVAVRGNDGTLSALPARRARFELQRWLEHDGDARTIVEAAKASAFKCDSVGCVARVKGVALSVLRHPAAFADDCTAAQVLVLNVPRPKRGCQQPAKVIDVFDVWREGTHALYVEAAAADGAPQLRVETVARARGERPWSMLPPRTSAAAPSLGPNGKGHEAIADGATNPKGAEAAASDASANVRVGPDATPPRFAARPGWMHQGPPRPEIEDDGFDGELPEPDEEPQPAEPPALGDPDPQ